MINSAFVGCASNSPILGDPDHSVQDLSLSIIGRSTANHAHLDFEPLLKLRIQPLEVLIQSKRRRFVSVDERGCPPYWVLENTGKRCAAMETNGNQVVGNDALHVRIVSMMSYHPCLSTQILKVILGYRCSCPDER